MCSRYKKSSMGVLTAWAGSAALALSIHWWLCRTLLFLGRRDAKLYDTPAEHWLALVSDQNCCMAARYSFLMLWTALFVAARRIQTGTTKRTKKEEYNDWFQAGKGCAKLGCWFAFGAEQTSSWLLPLHLS